MRVIAIDSATVTGWAVMRAPGVLEACGSLRTGVFTVSELARTYRNVDLAGIEDQYRLRNQHTFKVLARISGRWAQAFEAEGVETTFVPAATWQRAVLGTGSRAKRAELKERAKERARAVYGIPHPTSDEADAVCFAEYLVTYARS